MSQAIAFPDVPTFKLASPEAPLFRYAGFKQSCTTLPAGHVKEEGARPLPEALIFDRDVAIEVRDGTKLYADVFRQANDEHKKVPALLPWSPCAVDLVSKDVTA